MGMDTCCCMSGKAFDLCCGPYLEGKKSPESPEELMRSRYTAFSRGQAAYLWNTLDPENRRVDDREALARTIATTRWLGLCVISAKVLETDFNIGFVEFAAFYEQGGLEGQLHELSRFSLKENRWYYWGGDILPPLAWGRNQACWCGSQRKFKKCHGK